MDSCLLHAVSAQIIMAVLVVDVPVSMRKEDVNLSVKGDDCNI